MARSHSSAGLLVLAAGTLAAYLCIAPAFVVPRGTAQQPELDVRDAAAAFAGLTPLDLGVTAIRWPAVVSRRPALWFPAVVPCGGARMPVMCAPMAPPSPTAAQQGQPALAQRCVAEAIGTFLVVHGGCGVVCASKYCGSSLNTGQQALVWGLAVALAVYATRDISGAHLNPAITASLAVNKPDDFPKEEAAPFVLAQVLGAAVAGAVNYLVCRSGIAALEAAEGIVRGTAASTASFNGAFGMTPNPKLLSPLGALAAEVWMTAVFTFLVFAATDSASSVPKAAAPALIGGAVAMLASIFGPITGCGMNPARDLGPRLVTAVAGWGGAALSSWWVYTLGPMAGAVLGGAFYQATFAEKR